MEDKELRKIISDLQGIIADQSKVIKSLTKKTKKNSDPNSVVLRQAFVDGYINTFGHEYPCWGAKENAQIRALLNGVGLDKGMWLVDWYFKWTDPYIVQAGHPLGLLTPNIVKMEAQLRRKGRYFEQVATSRATKRVMLEGIERDKGVEIHGELKARQRGNISIGFRTNGELPTSSESELPIERSGSNIRERLLETKDS